MPDEKNPHYLFQQGSNDLLIKIASEEIDCKTIAIEELKKRGRDASGNWIGFNNQ